MATDREIAERLANNLSFALRRNKLVAEAVNNIVAALAQARREGAEADLSERDRHWLAEIDRLRTIIAWCRPRLMHEYYRGALDKYLADPTLATNADHTKIVQSPFPIRQRGEAGDAN